MKTKTKNTILVTMVSMVALIVPSLILGKYIEATIFFFCHWYIREQFPLQYHSVIPSMCRILTAIIMFMGVVLIFPFEFSLFSSIPIAYFISWIGYNKKKSDIFEVKCMELEENLASIKDKYNNKDDFIIKCQNANLGKRDTEIAIKYFIEKQKPKEIWLWLCENKEYEYIEWDSIHQLLWRLGKKLNK